VPEALGSAADGTTHADGLTHADETTRSTELAGAGDPRPTLEARRILGALDQPVGLLALDGRILHLTDAAVRLLATDRDALRDCTLPELSADPVSTSELLRLWAGSTGRRPGSFVLADGPRASERLRCDGARLDAGTLIVRFRNDLDQDHLALLTREVEATSLRELQSRLHATLAELEDANRQLGSRNSELERYAAAVAHDLRTPLYIVRGYAELLATGQVAEIDEEGRGLLAEVLRGADRMSAVIDGLLAVARLQVATPATATDSRAALQIVLDEHREEIAATGAQVEVGPVVPAWAEPIHLVQVLSNLVGNSLKFRRPDGPPHIWITARRRDGATEFAVQDDGIGVPAADRERIFDLFDRGQQPPEQPGTGIGLATCRKIVESYGGEIRCEASDDGGARFVFTIVDPAPTPLKPDGSAGSHEAVVGRVGIEPTPPRL
jgi:signal transduction histidine kinase